LLSPSDVEVTHRLDGERAQVGVRAERSPHSWVSRHGAPPGRAIGDTLKRLDGLRSLDKSASADRG